MPQQLSVHIPHGQRFCAPGPLQFQPLSNRPSSYVDDQTKPIRNKVFVGVLFLEILDDTYRLRKMLSGSSLPPVIFRIDELEGLFWWELSERLTKPRQVVEDFLLQFSQPFLVDS